MENFSISPTVVRKLAEGQIDGHWIEALTELEKRSSGLEAKAEAHPNVKATQDIKPLLGDLKHRVFAFPTTVNVSRLIPRPAGY